MLRLPYSKICSSFYSSTIPALLVMATVASYLYMTTASCISISGIRPINDIKRAENLADGGLYEDDQKHDNKEPWGIPHYSNPDTDPILYTTAEYTPSSSNKSEYHYCNMPHVSSETYIVPSEGYQLKYVEVIQRHHKRTPYLANMFPDEELKFSCANESLFYGASYSNKGESKSPPFTQVLRTQVPITGGPLSQLYHGTLQSTCAFPQITTGGLQDSFSHGKDLWGVYGELLGFLNMSELKNDNTIKFRVSTNPITSQVSSQFIKGMLGPYGKDFDSVIVEMEPEAVDTLNAKYPCPGGSSLKKLYTQPTDDNLDWSNHLKNASSLFKKLDSISGVTPSDEEWHSWIDHYFDNLSFRKCHNLPYPCSNSGDQCITEKDALEVFEMGDWEYNYIYRNSLDSTVYSTSQSLYLWELKENISERFKAGSGSTIKYKHNFAHDNTIASILGTLQISPTLRWPGMGAEIVFEIWEKSPKTDGNNLFIRVLYNGIPMKTAIPSVESWDMIPLPQFQRYLNQTVGESGENVVNICLNG